MRAGFLAASLAVVCLSAQAKDQAQPKPAADSGGLVAMAPAGGMDFAGLNHFFDAARLRMQAVLAPKPSRPQASAPAAPAPAAALARGGWGRPSLVVPNPVETPAYHRTFSTLLSRPGDTDRYDELILKYAYAYHLDARLLKAIIAAESEFAMSALSPRGARGLMQVMPGTAEEFGVPRDKLSVPEYNIAAGAAYIARLFEAAWQKFKLKGVRYHDAPLWLKERIIAAYNAGPRFLFSHNFYPTTRNYVRKVLLFYNSKVTDLRRPVQPSFDHPKFPVALTPGTLY